MVPTLFAPLVLAPLAAFQTPLSDTLQVDLPGLQAGTLVEAVPHEGLLFFPATSPSEGRELWVTDGTTAGTVSLGDLEPGVVSSDPEVLLSAEAGLYFTAQTSTQGRELWISDGTPGGTRLVVELAAGAAGGLSLGSQAAELGGEVYFSARDDAGLGRLWRTDGTAAGTEIAVTTGVLPRGVEVELFTQSTGALGFITAAVARFGDRILFSATSEAAFTDAGELWSTDGTSAGTFQIAPKLGISPFGFSTFGQLVVSGERAFFTQDLFSIVSLSALSWTDGTAAGTETVETANGFARLVGLDGGLFYTVLLQDTVLPEDQVWSLRYTEGTLDSTTTVTGGYFGAIFDGGVRCGDRVAYTLRTAPQQGVLPENRLITSKQAGEGLASIGSQNGLIIPLFGTDLQCVGTGEGILVTVDSEDFGRELGLADPVGGTLVAWTDSMPGPGDSSPRPLGRLGDDQLFWADGAGAGHDLHAVSVSAAGSSVFQTFGTGCGAELGGAGPVTIGAPLEFGAASGVPVTPALLFRSVVPLWLSLDTGCVLHLSAPVLAQSATTDAEGFATFALGVPALPALIGRQLFYQAAFLAPGGAAFGSFLLSNGVEVVFGP